MNGAKKCTRCQEFRDPSSYYADKSRTDGLAARCKDCTRTVARERRKRNLGKNEAILHDLKALGCCVCGEKDPVVLQFHHIDRLHRGRHGRSNRKINSSYVAVGDAKHNESPQKFIEHLRRTVVLCANDHLRVHAGMYKDSLGPSIEFMATLEAWYRRLYNE